MMHTIQESLFKREKSNKVPYRVSMRDGRKLVASEVFDTYWRFAAERQSIFLRRLNKVAPLTSDPILDTFKFTNSYRASDRVSQFLISQVIYRENYSLEDLFFRILIFKVFNSINTWELLETEAGPISLSNYRYRLYDSILSKAMGRGSRIYSAAYIMPSGGPNGEARKHRSHLLLLERMLADDLPAKISRSSSMGDSFALLKGYPMIGDFLAYQFITDINYSPICNYDEMEFVMPGPGARDGIKKCFPDAPSEWAADIIRWVAETQEEHFKRLNISFDNLWGRPLQLIDCQNLFCEVDKYARVAHPHIVGITGRTRIKQQFRPTLRPLKLFYPPKWGINQKLPQTALL
jgi:hypothetical protein